MTFINKVSKILTLCIVFALFCLIKSQANAITIEPQAYGSEKRIKYWRYYQNAVFKHTGFLNFPCYIQFEDGETVSNVSIASPQKKIVKKNDKGEDVTKYEEDDEQKWLFEIKGSKLFLKPVEDDGNTIAIVITNKRTYFFELHVKVPTGPFDTRIPLGISFQYPAEKSEEEKNGEENATVIQYNSKSAPDLSKPQNYNFNYTIAGNDIIAPIKIFDDGQFTYLEFKDKNATLPAVFGVDGNGYEFIQNFRIVGDYMVIESISPTMTLRNGSDIVCMFNESMKNETGVGIKKQANKDNKTPFEVLHVPQKK